MEGDHAYDGDAGLKFVKSRFVRGGLCPTLSDYKRSQNRIKASETEGHVLHKRGVCNSRAWY